MSVRTEREAATFRIGKKTTQSLRPRQRLGYEWVFDLYGKMLTSLRNLLGLFTISG